MRPPMLKNKFTNVFLGINLAEKDLLGQKKKYYGSGYARASV